MAVLEEDGGKIKPAKFKHDYTPEQIREIARCAKDPVYFIKTYVKIDAKGKVVPFAMYEFQERMIENYLRYDRVISMLPRQVGKTTVTAAFMLWWCCFKSRQEVRCFSYIGDASTEIMNRFKQQYEDLPWWIKPGVVVNNVMSMKFDNGSRIKAETTTHRTGRGQSPNLLYLDEFAYVDPAIQDAFWTSISASLAETEGKALITSTPNTDEDRFARIWFGAKDAPNSFEWQDEVLSKMGVSKDDEKPYETIYEDEEMRVRDQSDNFHTENADDDDPNAGFRRFFVHWQEHPARDEKWKQKRLRTDCTLEEWYREFECRFVSGDETLIDAMHLLQLNATVRKPMLVDKKGVRWYRKIRSGSSYAVVIDPSEGVGGSNGVVQAWELPSMRQVAEWAEAEVNSVVQTQALFHILYRINKAQQRMTRGYSDLYYSVEANGVGAGIIALILPEEEKFPGYFIDSEGNKGRGLKTTMPSKKEYALQLKYLIERKIFIPASAGLVSELKTFIKRGKTYGAKTGTRDDRVMSCVLMCHLLEELKFQVPELDQTLHTSVAALEALKDDEIPLPPVV